ncbi:hypothetical protein NM688_g3973 [Phlebia brevispora]|uniref:Uncharacterized protein n=1 Tax=Phlebia brevispora TaxID=194682 RepID=A0ACC1T4L5_9APHY|nr:hypothetical protein NM688_g3973 [Phlebia brevispora]
MGLGIFQSSYLALPECDPSPSPLPLLPLLHRPQHRTATQRTHTPATLTRSDACPGHSRTSSTQATRYSSVSESSQASMDRRILSHLSSLDEVPETPNVAMDAFCDDVEDNQLVEEEEEEVDMRTDDEIFRDALLRELKRDISYTHPKERGSLINEIAKSARFIPRVSGPFMNLYNIMMDGIALLNRDDPNDTSYILRFGKKSAMDRTIAAQTFEDLMDLLPAVNINIRYISQGGNDFLNKFCRFISFNYRAARQEDTNKLKEYVVVLLGPPPAGVKPLKMKGSKSERGFNHVQSAHMLCPRILLPLFDTNPKRFMEMVKNGKVLITADAFPTFMYDEQEDFDEKNIQKGFCRSQFLLKAYRNRFTGPRSSEKETPGLIGSGKKSIAEDNNMHKVTPDSVAYIATQTCMALGTLEQFGPEEGKFSYVEFFHMIRALLSDEEDPWAVETMQWWNQWVFGINTENGTGATQDANAQDVTMIKSMAEIEDWGS